ncbi:MAG: RNA 2'-phosphotransferase [Candidatus Vecturithrix sp.]|nr:RNA 2'-phosphotransferase [Candidatus Vecturithrix sp.]
MNDTQLSTVVSHALRHEPWLYELELDEQGWVDVVDLLSILRYQRSNWKDLTKADLCRMIDVSDKKRHQIEGDRIRALYGHSIPGKLLKKKACPPEQLYHGTTQSVVERIREQGLLPMDRQYVHLSIDIGIAMQVGRRKDRNPVILEVAAKEAFECGVNFYIGNDAVWLADQIPPKFIRMSGK